MFNKSQIEAPIEPISVPLARINGNEKTLSQFPWYLLAPRQFELYPDPPQLPTRDAVTRLGSEDRRQFGFDRATM